jgi:hypothetical protein
MKKRSAKLKGPGVPPPRASRDGVFFELGRPLWSHECPRSVRRRPIQETEECYGKEARGARAPFSVSSFPAERSRMKLFCMAISRAFLEADPNSLAPEFVEGLKYADGQGWLTIIEGTQIKLTNHGYEAA